MCNSGSCDGGFSCTNAVFCEVLEISASKGLSVIVSPKSREGHTVLKRMVFIVIAFFYP